MVISDDIKMMELRQLERSVRPKPTKLEKMHRIARRAVRSADLFDVIYRSDSIEHEYIVARLTERLIKGKPVTGRHVNKILRESNPHRLPTEQSVRLVVDSVREGLRRH